MIESPIIQSCCRCSTYTYCLVSNGFILPGSVTINNMTDARESAIPLALQEIPDKPKRLYVRGNLPKFEDYKVLTVVGSRRYTQYGKSVCERLIKGLAGYPIIIVSGLALGIDTLAHKYALDAGLTTVAFPGSGLADKVLYPASNYSLAKQILAAGGALISELEPSEKAANWTFPRRNRLMAGISDAVLLIEAGNKSGSRITARLATDYNRDVMAVPGSIFSEASEGTNELLREGAIPITKPEDILEWFGFTLIESRENKYAACTAEEQQVLHLLASPISRSELVRQLDMGISQANILLSAMEIKGLIDEHLGKLHLK